MMSFLQVVKGKTIRTRSRVQAEVGSRHTKVGAEEVRPTPFLGVGVIAVVAVGSKPDESLNTR